VEQAAPRLRIGLINNMSDGALEATERQFTALLESASEGFAIDLSLYSLPGIVRNEFAAHRVSHCYAGAETLRHSQLDGLIVTGREPLHPNLEDEPYWEGFASILEWARENAVSAIWSCLAAHGAVLFQDGIRRVPARNKHFGVYPCTSVSDHALTAGLPQGFAMPHSRWNGLPAEQLAACGYRVLSQAGDAGVDMFVQERKSLFVFFQGHPEYAANTLLLEYRRDIWRFLRGETALYPQVPKGYFDPATAARLMELQRDAEHGRVDLSGREVSAILDDAGTSGAWQPAASAIYRNWLRHICAQKEMRRAAQAGLSVKPMAPVPELFAISRNAESRLRGEGTATA
jgi:homoserine O-succinyltransferase